MYAICDPYYCVTEVNTFELHAQTSTMLQSAMNPALHFVDLNSIAQRIRMVRTSKCILADRIEEGLYIKYSPSSIDSSKIE